MGGCPGIWRNPGLGPANTRNWDRDRDSEPRDSRNREKHLRDSPAAKIPRDNKSRNFGTRIPLSPGTVPLSRDSTGNKSRLVPRSIYLFLSRIVFGPSMYIIFNVYSMYIMEFPNDALDFSFSKKIDARSCKITNPE